MKDFHFQDIKAIILSKYKLGRSISPVHTLTKLWIGKLTDWDRRFSPSCRSFNSCFIILMDWFLFSCTHFFMIILFFYIVKYKYIVFFVARSFNSYLLGLTLYLSFIIDLVFKLKRSGTDYTRSFVLA